MIRKLIVSLMAVLLLTSCSATIKQVITEKRPDGTVVTTETVDTETSVYHRSIAQHSIAESTKAVAQASAIKEVSVEGLSTDAQALLVDRKLTAIASLETKPYVGEKPTNGYDVAETAVKEGKSWITSIVTGTVAVKGLDTMKAIAERPTKQIVAQDGSEINYEEHDNKAIASGGSQANAGASGNQGLLRDVESGTMGSNGTSSTDTPSYLSAFNECSGGGSYESSLGSVGVCMQEALGRDVEIEGGLLYIDGTPYDPVNEWEANRVE